MRQDNGFGSNFSVSHFCSCLPLGAPFNVPVVLGYFRSLLGPPKTQLSLIPLQLLVFDSLLYIQVNHVSAKAITVETRASQFHYRRSSCILRIPEIRFYEDYLRGIYRQKLCN